MTPICREIREYPVRTATEQLVTIYHTKSALSWTKVSQMHGTAEPSILSASLEELSRNGDAKPEQLEFLHDSALQIYLGEQHLTPLLDRSDDSFV